MKLFEVVIVDCFPYDHQWPTLANAERSERLSRSERKLATTIVAMIPKHTQPDPIKVHKKTDKMQIQMPASNAIAEKFPIRMVSSRKSGPTVEISSANHTKYLRFVPDVIKRMVNK